MARPKGLPRDPVGRFWAYVERRGDEECWPWLGSLYRGYGRIMVAGSRIPVTRFSWSLRNGPWPAERYACHTCDNPRCVNPQHIWPGTAEENQRDAVAKKRHHCARKTHCVHGHAFSEANTYINPRGDRMCRTCLVASQRSVRARRTAARLQRVNGAGSINHAQPNTQEGAEDHAS